MMDNELSSEIGLFTFPGLAFLDNAVLASVPLTRAEVFL